MITISEEREREDMGLFFRFEGLRQPCLKFGVCVL